MTQYLIVEKVPIWLSKVYYVDAESLNAAWKLWKSNKAFSFVKEQPGDTANTELMPELQTKVEIHEYDEETDK